MDHHKTIFFSQDHHFFIKLDTTQGAGGIVGIVQDYQFGPRVDIFAHHGDAFDKGFLALQSDAQHAATGYYSGIHVDRKGRGGNQNRVPLSNEGQAQMGDALFGADGANHLVVRIQRHIIVFLVVFGDLPAQVAHAVGHGIPMGFGIVGHLHQFVDHRLRCRVHGVAHAQIDHIVPIPAFFHLHLVDHAEQIGGQLGHAPGKFNIDCFFHGYFVFHSKTSFANRNPGSVLPIRGLKRGATDRPLQPVAW